MREKFFGSFLQERTGLSEKLVKRNYIFAHKGENKQKTNNRKNYLREKKRAITSGEVIVKGSSSEKEHKENALASGADEGRD